MAGRHAPARGPAPPRSSSSNERARPCRSSFRPIAPATLALVAIALIAATANAQNTTTAFLADQLPLRPLSTTPSELLPIQPTAQPVTLSGRQAITAVFSRPVIALGADFGVATLPPNLVPFELTCGIPGRLRWVTTSIARFDPSVEWPPDLSCAFRWNSALKAFDGAPLQLPSSSPPQIPLLTDPLSMSLSGVTSRSADAATGGLWSADLGLEDDGLPEVPPGESNVTLSFSYPVDLGLLADALRLKPVADRRGVLPSRARAVAVLPCAGGGWWEGPGPRPLPGLLRGRAAGTRGSSSDAASTASTCAVVRIDPPLRPQEAADIVLPRGSRYAALAGPVSSGSSSSSSSSPPPPGVEGLSVRVFGLRRFRLPLRRDFTNRTQDDAKNPRDNYYVGVASRRLEFWLPHGLAEGTGAAQLQPLVSLCRLLVTPFATPALPRNCGPPLAMRLERPEKGLLVASVPELEAGGRYLLRVQASARVRDAFGLPLEGDATAFWTQPLQPGLEGPSGSGSDATGVLIFEPGMAMANGTASPLPWPLVARGDAAAASGGDGGQGGDPTVATRWAVPIGGDGDNASLIGRALQMMSYAQTQRAADAFGASKFEQSVKRPPGPQPSFSALALPGGAGGAQLVSLCCRTVDYPVKREVDASAQLVLTTGLQAVAVVGSGEVVVWVTRAVNGASGASSPSSPSTPVAGARVSLWRAANPYGGSSDPSLIARASASPLQGMSCVTGTDGACAMPASPLKRPNEYTDVYAVVATGEEGTDGKGDGGAGDAIVVPRLPLPSSSVGASSSSPSYRGTLVLDRRLVRPGEELKVAAFAQGEDVQNGGLSLAAAAPLARAGGAVAVVSPNPAAPQGDSSTPPLRLPVSFDADFGSAHFSVPIPVNATPGTYSLVVQAAAEEGGGGASGGGGGRAAAKIAAPGSVVPVFPGGAGGPVVATASFTVADPRPPTADLTLTAPAWALSRGAFDVSLQATSYLGGSVAGAPVEVSWSREGGGGGGGPIQPFIAGGGASASSSSGSARAVTDARGAAKVRVDLSKLPIAGGGEEGGDDGGGGGGTLTVRASWVGPTRELITRETTVRLEAGPYRVQLERTLDADVPGVPFGVAATALSNEVREEEEGEGGGGGAADDVGAAASSTKTTAAGAAAGATVEVSLVLANGTTPSSLTAGGCTPAQLADLSRQRCSGLASPSPPRLCQLSLPCAGRFLLRACVVKSPDGSPALTKPSCTDTPLGRNATEWRQAPWSRQPELKLLPDRRPEGGDGGAGGDGDSRYYREGDTATLAFQNPYWGPASALVLWSAPSSSSGGGEDDTKISRRLVASVPRGSNAIRIPITRQSGCWPLGCRVAVVLSVGRPANASSSPSLPPVPTSRLFDPRAPHTASATAFLAVKGGGEPLRVELAVETPAGVTSSSSSSTPPLIAPLSDDSAVAVRVLFGGSSAADAGAAGAPVANAQVTVFAVDEAVLDLLPYSLQDLSAILRPAVEAYLQIKGVNDARATREAVSAVFAALRRRLLTSESADPWLPLETRVVPGGFYGPVYRPGVVGGRYYGGDSSAAAPVDVEDGEYFSRFGAAVTVLPGGGGGGPRPVGFVGGGGVGYAPMVAMASMAAPGPLPVGAVAKRAAGGSAEAVAADAEVAIGGSNGGGGGGAVGAGGDAALRLAEAFLATPLYSVVETDPEGRARVPIKAPANVGAFVVRAYAVVGPDADAATAAARYGSSESKFIVARPVSLVPSLPRLARVGDVFEAGVQVSLPVAPEKETRVLVSAQVVVGASDGKSNATTTPPLELLTAAGAEATALLGPEKLQAEVRFRFAAAAVGNGSIVFSARLADDDKKTIADRAQLELPVEGRQGEVVVATSFAVRPQVKDDNNTAAALRGEGLALPQAEPGSPSTVDLLAGVGMLPAVRAAYTTVLDQRSREVVASAPLAVATASIPAMLAAYSDGSSSSPFVPGVVPSAANATASSRAAADAAGELTDARFGLMYVSPLAQAKAWGGRPDPPTRADVDLNAWGAWVVERAAAAARDGGASSSSSSSLASRPAGGAEYSRALQSLSGPTADTWRSALARQIVADAEQARRPTRGPAAGAGAAKGGPYSDLETLSWARLALGSRWQPPEGTAEDVARDLSTSRLAAAAAAGNLTVGGAARAALALAGVDGSGGNSNAASDADLTTARAIARRLSGQIRVAGRTAYFAASSASSSGGARSAAPLSDQSLALRLLVALNQSDPAEYPLTQKIAAYVAQGPPRSPYGPLCVSLGGWEAALQAEALAAYDRASGSARPDLVLTATAYGGGGSEGPSDSLVLLRAAFNGSTSSSSVEASASVPWSSLPANASSLRFVAEGRGEASVAAALRFTPAELLPFPTYRGLWVQRAVQRIEAAVAAEGEADGGSNGDGATATAPPPPPSASYGPSLRAARLGDVVSVVLQVTTPDDLPDVMVEAWMPAGLEPIDTNVPGAGGGGGGGSSCSRSEDEDGGGGGGFGGGSGGGGGFFPEQGEALVASAPMVKSSGAAAGGVSSSFAAPSVASLPSPPPFAPPPFAPSSLARPFLPPWLLCPTQETRPSKVRFYYPFLRAGTHTLRFRAVAATPGRFALPPTKAWALRQPEVMGLSAAGAFVVCAPDGGASFAECSGQSAVLPPESPAKACPSNCSGAGACNLSTGACLCDAGWQGADCSRAAAGGEEA